MSKGWDGSLQGTANTRDRGTLTETNPIVYDQFARMAAQFPREFGTPQVRLDILRHADELGTDDLNRLLDANASFADPKKAGKAMADWSDEGKRLGDAYRFLGIDGNKSSDKEKQALFAQRYRRSLRIAIQSSPDGKAPPPDKLDAMVQSLVNDYHKNGDSFIDSERDYSKAATQSVTLGDGRTFTGQDVADAQAALRRAGKPDSVADAVNALGNYR